MPERYVIREITGWTITPGRNSGSTSTTDVMVLDSHDCYRVAGYFPGDKYSNRHTGSALRRIQARHLCYELNEEHRAAMLAPMQAAATGEAAQADREQASC